jgi:hypothetical protein
MSVSSGNAERSPSAVIAQIDACDVDLLRLSDVQVLMDLAVRAYGRILEEEKEQGSILPPVHGVTATDVSRAASALLDALNIEIFELALWESWGGRPWAGAKGGEGHLQNKLKD